MMIQKNDKILADNIRPADSFSTRFIGLMGKKMLKEQEGLLLFSLLLHSLFFYAVPDRRGISVGRDEGRWN